MEGLDHHPPGGRQRFVVIESRAIGQGRIVKTPRRMREKTGVMSAFGSFEYHDRNTREPGAEKVDSCEHVPPAFVFRVSSISDSIPQGLRHLPSVPPPVFSMCFLMLFIVMVPFFVLDFTTPARPYPILSNPHLSASPPILVKVPRQTRTYR